VPNNCIKGYFVQTLSSIVGKPSAIGQPTRPTHSALHSFGVDNVID